MSWRDDWSRRHLLMEQARQKSLTGAFVQTEANSRLKQLDTDISIGENEIKQWQLESDVYAEKIN